MRPRRSARLTRRPRYVGPRRSVGSLTRLQALFQAQGTLLAEATKEVFGLQTQRKESQHKIDRLHDYERQIEQHVKVQRLWCVYFPCFILF